MKKLFLLVAAFVVCTSYSFAQQASETNVQVLEGGQKINVPDEVQVLNMVGTLVKYGYEQESALSLIQAIEISQNFTSEGTRAGKKVSESDGEITDATKQSKISYDIEKLLTDAVTFADGDEHLLAIIEGLKNSATRGATKDYAVHYDKVNAKSTDSYTIRFRGGEEACVIVCGDGDTDLDLYVYDENGNLVDSDTDTTDACVAVWNPKWTGPFTIKIKNLGNVYNRYSLTVN